jgi:hypothetical protein
VLKIPAFGKPKTVSGYLPDQYNMETKEIFLNACNEICNKLDSFKLLQKGQTLKKVAQEKDIFFEIYFQSSYRNDKSYIQVLPHINIYSKQLKKWTIEQTQNKYSNGLIFGGQIGHLTPYKQWKEWNVAGMNYQKSVVEISDNIQKYIYPIFDIFEQKENAIDFLTINGTKFNLWTENVLTPLNFMLCFADKQKSETFFNNFIDKCTYKEKIISFYQNLPKETKIDLNYSEFVFADRVKLAFINGLKINSR